MLAMQMCLPPIAVKKAARYGKVPCCPANETKPPKIGSSSVLFILGYLSFMMTEKEKMLSGALYNALDDQLLSERTTTRTLLKKLNDAHAGDHETARGILRDLMPAAAMDLWIQPPFYCDYGYNIETGEKVFLNFNCVILDVMKVSIGSRTLLGPNVQIYTATHPMNWRERAAGLEYAKPVVIGEDVWIGGSVVVCPGVAIGNRSVIGAGSVVTRDIPDDVFAAGNPCKVIRRVDQHIAERE